MGLCIKCASVKTSCCINREIFVTENDIERISSEVQHDQFYEFRCPADPEYLVQEDDPNWNSYTVQQNGTRRVLKHRNGTACIFLSPHGCELTYGARPLICRIHPLTYNEEKFTGLDNDCPAELLEKGEDLLNSLGMNESLAEQWRKQLYAELVSEKIRKELRVAAVVMKS